MCSCSQQVDTNGLLLYITDVQSDSICVQQQWLTIRVVKVNSGPDAAVQEAPLYVVGLRVPHAQPLVILNCQRNMLPSLVGDEVLLQFLIEAGVAVGHLHQLPELAHCRAVSECQGADDPRPNAPPCRVGP